MTFWPQNDVTFQSIFMQCSKEVNYSSGIINLWMKAFYHVFLIIYESTLVYYYYITFYFSLLFYYEQYCREWVLENVSDSKHRSILCRKFAARLADWRNAVCWRCTLHCINIIITYSLHHMININRQRLVNWYSTAAVYSASDAGFSHDILLSVLSSKWHNIKGVIFNPKHVCVCRLTVPDITFANGKQLLTVSLGSTPQHLPNISNFVTFRKHLKAWFLQIFNYQWQCIKWLDIPLNICITNC